MFDKSVAQRWFNSDGLLIGSYGRLHLLDENGVVVTTFKSKAEYDRMREEACAYCGDIPEDGSGLCLDCATTWPPTGDPCEFFAGCTNEAEGTLFHPFRVHPGRPDGLIPTCRHCAGRVEEDEYDRMREEAEADSEALCRAEALQDADRAMLPSGCLHCGDPVLQDGPLCVDCAIDADNDYHGF